MPYISAALFFISPFGKLNAINHFITHHYYNDILQKMKQRYFTSKKNGINIQLKPFQYNVNILIAC